MPWNVSAAALAASGMPARVGQQVADLLGDAERQAEPRRDEVPSAPRCRSSPASSAARCGRGRWHRAGARRITLEVEVLQRQFDAAFAVGDRVVHLLDDGRLAAAHPLDDRELPERTGPVERIGDDQRWRGRAPGATCRASGRRCGGRAGRCRSRRRRPRPAVRGWPAPASRRWRRRGMVTIARSMRRRSESKSGARSRTVTVPNVDDRCGSFSSRHIRPSASLMLRSNRIPVMRADYGGTVGDGTWVSRGPGGRTPGWLPSP